MALNLKGQVFGRLTVIQQTPGAKTWDCVCSCGNLLTAHVSNLRRGATKSCGCLKKEMYSSLKGNSLSTVHGHSTDPLYATWDHMWRRCTDPSRRGYEYYKNRTPPESWKDFETFKKDMGPRPEGYSLERKENNKPYGPENCIWATVKDQARNSSRNVNLTFQGKTQCLTAWAEELNLPYSSLKKRLSRGWSVEKTLTEPIKGN